MDDGFYLNFIDELEHWFYIQLGWGKQGFAQSGTIKLFEDVSWCVLQIKYLSYQRETVGMYTGGWKRDQNIANLNIFRINHLVLVHYTNAESSNVIFINWVKTWHFCGFTANQSTSGFNTAVCNTFYDVCNLFRDVFAQCDIIKEDKWFCSAADDVVYTHCYTVDTNGIMLVEHKCQLQFCANTVCTGNQNRFADTGQIQLKGAAESTDSGHHACCHRSGNVCLHQFNCFVSGCYVYAGCLIAFAETLAHIV